MDVLNTVRLLRTVARSRLHGLLRLRAVTTAVRLECPPGQCGLCCRVMGDAVHVDTQERSLLVQISENRGLNSTGTALPHSTAGACLLLENSSCSIYDQRPRSCREYPWYNIDGLLFVDTGCPGIRFDSAASPQPSAITPIEVLLQELPLPLAKILKWIFSKW